MSEEHPFKPGVGVIVCRNRGSYSDGEFSEDRVLKLHKSGRFTLASDPAKQWRASLYHGDRHWSAYPTERSHGWSSYVTSLRLSDAEAKKEMDKAREKRKHRDRCAVLEKKFNDHLRIDVQFSQRVYDLIAHTALLMALGES